MFCKYNTNTNKNDKIIIIFAKQIFVSKVNC